MGLAKAKWTRNFKKNTKLRPNIYCTGNKNSCKRKLVEIPSNKDVVGTFMGLYAKTKSGANRIKRISKEIITLWNQLRYIPHFLSKKILFKVDKPIKLLEKHRKRQNKQFEENLPHVFDITKPNGSWLCYEDLRTS